MNIERTVLAEFLGDHSTRLERNTELERTIDNLNSMVTHINGLPMGTFKMATLINIQKAINALTALTKAMEELDV
jgi:hypothetical protein